MADIFKEQFAAVKLCFLSGRTVDEARTMLEIAYGDSAFVRSKIYDFFARFRRGEMEIEERGGASQDVVEKLGSVVSEDRRCDIEDLVDITGFSEIVCQRTLKEELCMKKVAGKWTSSKLSADQKLNRLALCDTVNKILETDMFAKVVTGDEFFCYSDRTKSGTICKIMLIAFYDVKGFLHVEFVPAGRTISSQKYYLGVLGRLVESVQQKRPEWRLGDDGNKKVVKKKPLLEVLPAQHLDPSNQLVTPTFQQENPSMIDVNDDVVVKIEDLQFYTSDLSTATKIDPIADSSNGCTNVEIKSENDPLKRLCGLA
ncbi:hypothetical protein GE061_005800 [Apolygus lucorum]|uniref:Mos1 transposase HTH domain-containing protein n=1 Tax=Apolygus lucorum TaxID=248454 RepID=A0A6A4JFF7_APOLU|nr:hypothetical protein GE061_005800 [Apolygus lucorum]